ncbi:hypothetical protein C2G38_2222916 [Gigaspora rosea]|uniref:Uncharacterized protein n=1 Tax=Gigaspora rosea TaxID=44941 RepID=A0A397UAA8_9GLOM|nr:hypothetical protein C2G38_2222916 [Gigaspora rosea]
MSYFNLHIFAFLLNFIFTFAAEFVPPGRIGHKSVLVDKKLYIYSGDNQEAVNLDNFYLDVSQNFTTTAALQCNILEFLKNVLPRGGNNNDLIFIFGESREYINDGNTFTARLDTNDGGDLCAKFNNESIAVIAGSKKMFYPANDIWIFDSLKSTWSKRFAPDTPQDITSYSAIILPDQAILYTGESSDAMSLNSPFYSLIVGADAENGLC